MDSTNLYCNLSNKVAYMQQSVNGTPLNHIHKIDFSNIIVKNDEQNKL